MIFISKILSVLLISFLLQDGQIYCTIFDSVCHGIRSGENKIDAFGIVQAIPGFRFYLISGPYLYNLELSEAVWGSIFHKRESILLHNRTLVRDNWPLLPLNYTNATDGAIMGDSAADWLVFRTDLGNGRRKVTYQNIQHTKVVHLLEFDTPPRNYDFQLVSSTIAHAKYGIGQLDKTGGKSLMCLFEVERVDKANERSDYRKVSRKGLSDRCTEQDRIDRVFLDNEGKHMYVAMHGFNNMSIYEISSDKLKVLQSVNLHHFFTCVTYLDIFLIICFLLIFFLAIGGGAYYLIVYKNSGAQSLFHARTKDSLTEVAMKRLKANKVNRGQQDQTKSPRSPKPAHHRPQQQTSTSTTGITASSGSTP